MKVQLTITKDNGEQETFEVQNYLFLTIMDAFVAAEYANENWNNTDTVNLIIQKLKGLSPIEFVNLKTDNQCQEQ